MPTRRSLSETRDLLLDIGARMLVDDGIRVTIGHISLIDVCREAGLKTAGSGYKIWPNQEDFRVDLLRHLLETPDLRTDTLEHLGDDIVREADHASFVEVVRSVSAASARANIENEGYVVYISLWLASRFDDDLLGRLRASDTDLLHDYAAIYDATVRYFGREWIPPFNADLLAVALSALVEGLSIRARSTPELVPTDLPRPTGPGGSEQPWHLFSCGALALFEAFTRPIDAARDHGADQSD